MARSTGNCGSVTPSLGGCAYWPSTGIGSAIQGLRRKDARPILLNNKPLEVFIIERIGTESSSALLDIKFLTSVVIALLALLDNIPEGQPFELGGDARDNGLHCILSKLSAEAIA
tara:strand:+ start:427 stop:771 length:345 start_codon:yes stop_codon:yes gene_type:complete